MDITWFYYVFSRFQIISGIKERMKIFGKDIFLQLDFFFLFIKIIFNHNFGRRPSRGETTQSFSFKGKTLFSKNYEDWDKLFTDLTLQVALVG